MDAIRCGQLPVLTIAARRLLNLALCAAAAAGVQVGAAIVASRFALQQVPPLMLRYAVGARFARHAGAVAAMGPRGDGGEGIGQFGVLITLLNLGLQRLSLDGRCWAITGAATWPAMALEASGLWLGTRRADNPAP